MSGSVDELAAAALKKRVDRLEVKVADLARKDRGLRIALICVGSALLVVAAIVVYLIDSRGSAREYYNHQLKMLVCSISPGDETRDNLRAQFDCGRSVKTPRAATPTPPSTARSPSRAPGRSSTSSPSTTRTVTGEVNIAPPSSKRATGSVRHATRGRPAAVPRAATTSTRTTTRVQPGPTRTVHAAPRTTARPGLLPNVLCTLLGCRTETP